MADPVAASPVGADSRAAVVAIADEIQARGRKHASGEPLYFDRYNLEQAISTGLLAATAAIPQTDPLELREQLETLCQAIEGHRAGSLTNDGLWHYWEKAQAMLRAADPSAAPREPDWDGEVNQLWRYCMAGSIDKVAFSLELVKLSDVRALVARLRGATR